MSLSTDRTALIRLTKEIGDLRTKEASEIKKEADATKNANTAYGRASKATSNSSASSYLSTGNRETQYAQRAQENRSKLANEIARKSQESAKLQERISKAEEAERKALATESQRQRREDERARKALAAANDDLRREYEASVTNLEAQIAAQIESKASDAPPFEISAAEGEVEPYDFFLSHAWADKEEFVDGFVRKAEAAGLRVWYDKFSLTWGDSIRQKIDEGLRNAYFGVVVLSPNFFSRPWTNYELDGIVQRDLSGKGRLLPIWHRLTQDDVEKHAPSLAGRLALSTASSSSDAIVRELIQVRDRFKAAMEAGQSSSEASEEE